jgi:rubrerythrin
MVSAQMKELLLQALEHERGGVLVYRTALECVREDELRKEWEGYLEQTTTHVEVLERACRNLTLDPTEVTPGCEIVRHLGKALVEAMQMARKAGDPRAAELVACDCVLLAETKDHANWQLIGECMNAMGKTDKEIAAALKQAYEQVEDEEDEHLYHSKGWGRELHLQALGLHAILPPPEEKRDVRNAIAAARAEKSAKRQHKH